MKDSMIVEFRDGNRALFSNGSLLGLNGFTSLNDYYNRDLTYKTHEFYGHPWDICVVYEIVSPHSLTHILNYGFGLKVLWQ